MRVGHDTHTNDTILTLRSSTQLAAAREAAKASLAQPGPRPWTDRHGNQPRKGCDILVQCLEREGVDTLFAYPGGASMEIHQALTRSPIIRNILCRHEQVQLPGLLRMWYTRGCGAHVDVVHMCMHT